MKALRTLLTTIVLLAGVMTMNAQRMSIVAMQSNARFLTDRMAYTLGIHDPYLIDEIYRINYDYIWGVNDYLDDVALGYYYDDYMAVCAARDAALRNLLGYTVWNRILGYNYFYRPIVFANRGWHFSIYDYDRFGPRHYFYAAPRPIARGYAGGHFFRGMPPRAGRPAGPAPGMAPRGGRPDMPPHGGAPAPHMDNRGGAPHGGQMQGNAPRGGQPQGGAPQGGQFQGGNQRGGYAGQQPQTPSQNRPSGNMNGGRTPSMGSGARSDNNMRSSSRTSAMGGATRVSNPAPTRGNMGGSAPARGGNAGAPRGNGRR